MAYKSFKCRFCLVSEGQGVSLFDHYVSEKKISIGLVASQLFDLKIAQEDGITGEICVQCFLKTCDYYFFKLKCQRNEHTLKESIREQKLEVNQCSIPVSNSNIQEIPWQISGLKKKVSPETSKRKRNVDESRDETSNSTKKLNSSVESLGSIEDTLDKSVECKSCLQRFPSHNFVDHVLQHIKLEKSTEIDANSSTVENVCQDMDWTFEKVNVTLAKSKLKCDPDLVIIKEVPDSDEFGGHLPLKLESETPLGNDLNDCTVICVRDGEDSYRGIREAKDMRGGYSVEENVSLCSMEFQVKREVDGHSPENEKLRRMLSSVGSSCDVLQSWNTCNEQKMGNERCGMDSCAKIQHSAVKETYKINNSKLKVTDVKSEWLDDSPAEGNLLKYKKELDLTNLSKPKSVSISTSSDKLENENILDKKNYNAALKERNELQQIATVKPSFKNPDIIIEDEIKFMTCFANNENIVLGLDECEDTADTLLRVDDGHRDISHNFCSTNGKSEKCEFVRNKLNHSNNSLTGRGGERIISSSSSISSLVTPYSIFNNGYESNDYSKRPSHQEFHLEEKSLTLAKNTTENCGPKSPFSFICSECQDLFSSDSDLLKHLSVHKKYGGLGATTKFNISQNRFKEKEKPVSLQRKRADICKVSTIEGRTPISSILSHSKKMVNGSQKDRSSKSLPTEFTYSSKKLSLESNVLKSNIGSNDSDSSGKPSVPEKKGSNMNKFDCWLCVQTFPTARLLLDHSYIHVEYAEAQNSNIIRSLSHSDILLESSTDRSQKNLHQKSKYPCSGYSTFSKCKSPTKFRFNTVTLSSGIIDRKLVEGKKLLQEKLKINDLDGKSSQTKIFRCPACLKKFSEWDTIVQHIINCHKSLSEDWPMKILFLPQLNQSIDSGKNPLINARNSGKNGENPLYIMRSMLCGLRCEVCYKPFHSERALLKHKVWAHPENIGV